MLNKFESTINSDFPDFKQKNIFVAISAGKDSMTLSHLLNQLQVKHTLLHCNFKLRGTESNEDEAFVLAYAQHLKLKIETKIFDTRKFAEINKLSIQEAARNLRYKWFNEYLKDDNSLLLTAHHLDDSIETFFINLLRGTGFNGIAGVPKLNNKIYRPLLSFSLDDILRYIDDNNIEYREDSSNQETKYLRNQIRHNLMPLLLNLEPNFKVKMENFFEEIINQKKWTNEQVKHQLAAAEIGMSTDPIYSLEKLVQFDKLVLLWGFKKFGMKRSILIEFTSFLTASTGSIFNTKTHSFLIDRGNLMIAPLHSILDQSEHVIADFPALLQLNNTELSLEIIPGNQFILSNNPLFIDADSVEFPLIVRIWRHSDRIQPFGLTGTKLVSDILIDNKISKFQKIQTLVLIDNNGTLIAIPGITISENHKISSDSKRILQIRIM